MTAKELDALARNLKLTKRERAFAEAYASGPTEGNGTNSARAAGYSGPDPALASAAWQVLKRLKVQTYLAELKGAAVVKASRKTGATIATMADALGTTSGIMRSQYRAMREDPAKRTWNGQLALSAAKVLVDHYDALDAPAAVPVQFAQVFVNLSEGAKAELVRAALGRFGQPTNGNGNGNGHAPLEIEARKVG